MNSSLSARSVMPEPTPAVMVVAGEALPVLPSLLPMVPPSSACSVMPELPLVPVVEMLEPGKITMARVAVAPAFAVMVRAPPARSTALLPTNKPNKLPELTVVRLRPSSDMERPAVSVLPPVI